MGFVVLFFLEGIVLKGAAYALKSGPILKPSEIGQQTMCFSLWGFHFSHFEKKKKGLREAKQPVIHQREARERAVGGGPGGPREAAPGTVWIDASIASDASPHGLSEAFVGLGGT